MTGRAIKLLRAIAHNMPVVGGMLVSFDLDGVPRNSLLAWAGVYHTTTSVYE